MNPNIAIKVNRAIKLNFDFQFNKYIEYRAQPKAAPRTHKSPIVKFKLIKKKDSNILDLQKSLEEKTGLNVSIANKKDNSGSISFSYQDLDQLDKIINAIKKNY